MSHSGRRHGGDLARGVLHLGAYKRVLIDVKGDGDGEEASDLRFFSYVWPTKPNGTRKGRTRICVNDGNNIHRLKKFLPDY